VINIIRFFLIYVITLNAYANNFALTKAEQTWLDAQPNITLSTSVAIPNFSMISEQGKLSGLLYDYLAIVSEKINKPITFIPFQEGQYSVEKVMEMPQVYGHTMLFNTEKNNKNYLLSHSYIQPPLIVFTTRNMKNTIRNIADLQGKKLAVLQSLTNLDFLKGYNNIELSRASNRLTLLDKLQYGEVDAVIGSIGFQHLIKENLYTSIIPAFNIKNNTPIMIGIKPEYPLLLSILNKVIDSLPKTTILRLSEKWFTNNELNDQWTEEELTYIKNHKILKVPNLNAFPPFNFNENGKPMGYSIDYLNLMADYMGVDIQYIQDISWSQTIERLKTGDIDIIPHIAITEEREKFIGYTNFTHIEYTTGMATRTDSNINSFEDLKNKTIAVTEKSFIHGYFQQYYPNQKLLIVPSTNLGIDAVSAGKADATIGSLPAMHYYIQKTWLSNIKIVNGLGFFGTTKLRMGTSKGNTTLLSILNKTHQFISKSEEIKLKEKWINTSPENNSQIKLTEKEVSYLAHKIKIKLCINPNWKPFESIEDGKHTGITAEYFTVFSNNLSIPIELVKTENFQETIDFAKKGICDIISVMPETKENLENFTLSQPYIATSLVITTKAKTPFIDDIRALSNKNIGVSDDCFCTKVLSERYPSITFIPTSSANEGLAKVSNNELFGFIAPFPVVAPLIQEDYFGEVKIAGKLENSKRFAMGIRDDNPELLSIFNKLIEHIPPATNQEIMNKYVTFKITNNIDYTKLLYISLFFILIIFIVVYKNRSVSHMHKKLKSVHGELTEQQKMINKYVLIVETDCQGIITDVNDAYCHALGFTRSQLIGQSHKSIRHSSMSKTFFQEMWNTISHDKTWSGEIFNYTINNETKCFNTYIEPVFRNKEKVGYRAICEDISDKKIIEKISMTDKLTGIFNRLKLDDLIVEQLQTYQRYKVDFSIILIDIDDFKIVNDTYGHDVGDNVLRQLAASLQTRTRVTDYVGRWGGEEFLIICPNTTAKNALIAAEYIRKSVEQEHFNQVNKITLSLGITGFIEGDTINSIFKRADRALYKAKAAGKNTNVIL